MRRRWGVRYRCCVRRWSPSWVGRLSHRRRCCNPDRENKQSRDANARFQHGTISRAAPPDQRAGWYIGCATAAGCWPRPPQRRHSKWPTASPWSRQDQHGLVRCGHDQPPGRGIFSLDDRRQHDPCAVPWWGWSPLYRAVKYSSDSMPCHPRSRISRGARADVIGVIGLRRSMTPDRSTVPQRANRFRA